MVLVLDLAENAFMQLSEASVIERGVWGQYLWLVVSVGSLNLLRFQPWTSCEQVLSQ